MTLLPLTQDANAREAVNMVLLAIQALFPDENGFDAATRQRIVRVVETALLRALLNDHGERVVPEPIDTWLLAAPHRMVTLMADRTNPGRIVSMLNEGMQERGSGRGATSAEANAHALNDAMGKQGA